MTPMMEKRQQLAAVLETVAVVKLGSAQLPEKIAAFYDDPVNHPLVLVDKSSGRMCSGLN